MCDLNSPPGNVALSFFLEGGYSAGQPEANELFLQMSMITSDLATKMKFMLSDRARSMTGDLE